MEAFDNTVISVYGSFLDGGDTAALLERLRTLTSSSISCLTKILDLSIALSTVYTSDQGQDYNTVFTKFAIHYAAIITLLCNIFTIEDTKGILLQLQFANNKHQNQEKNTLLSEPAQFLLEVLDPFSPLQAHSIWKQQITDDNQIVAVRCLLCHLYCHREYLVRKFAYSVPTTDVLSFLVNQNYGVIVSLGCGKAYWSHCLRQTISSACGNRLKVIPADIIVSNANPATDCCDGFCDSIVTVDPNDCSVLWEEKIEGMDLALLLCWVPKVKCESFIEALLTFPGTCLILVGEIGVGSASGSNLFWKTVTEHFDETNKLMLPRYLGWYDSVVVYKRK